MIGPITLITVGNEASLAQICSNIFVFEKSNGFEGENRDYIFESYSYFNL